MSGWGYVQLVIVEMDDVSTWPIDVRDAVNALADSVTGHPSHYDELELDPSAVDRIGELLAGHKLVAYHCTRLLDHEADGIRTNGLNPLSPEMIDLRITLACEHGAITTAERDRLHARHMFATDEHHNRGKRLGHVCFATTRNAFETHAHGLNPLLSQWGGEAVYFSAGLQGMNDRLKRIGKPSIVAAALPIKQPEPMGTYLGLPVYLTATWLKLPDVCCTLRYRAPVTGEEIISIWQPGDPEYDHYCLLVRS